ncbi:MAG: hypothetical protein DHS20C19_03200 [Acidimicrobiales bacterium]|nr:MAG: hypothetical protein DHS20C19_03200 [Acidimicrobiales bacterium]
MPHNPVTGDRADRALPPLSPRVEVALLARALFRQGYNDFNTGHMTYRQRDDTFLVLDSGVGWNEQRPSDVVSVDADGNRLEGAGEVTPAIILHLEYHKLHEDCIWTVHQHPEYATIWAAAGRIPSVYSQRGASLLEDIGLYEEYEGGVDEWPAANAAARAIGEKKAVLLRNHGVFVAGSDVAQVFSRCVALENRCRVAWRVEALGGGMEMPEPAQRSLLAVNRDRFGFRSPGLWEWAVRQELREDPTLEAEVSGPSPSAPSSSRT